MNNHIYKSGQWAAFNKVLNFINTVESKSVEKKDLYKAVMDMRPENWEEFDPE